MEVSPWDPTELVEPVFGKGPESLNAIEVISSFGNTFLLGDHHMVASDREERIRPPVIRIVETSWFRVVGD